MSAPPVGVEAPPHSQHTNRRAWVRTAVLATALCGLIIAAAGIMFSTFMMYDDEGYVLLTLRNFIEHGGLYRDIYTQYGPFPYAFYQLLNGLGVPITHSAGRLLTLAIWSGTALGGAVLVHRATRNLPLQLAVMAALFVYLWVLASEPSHPGGLIVATTMLLALIGHQWLAADRARLWAIAIGPGVAVLLLTKINIGVFATCSAAAWWALHHTDSRVRRAATWLLPVAAVLLPLGLMRSLLGVPWVQNYATVFALSAAATLLVAARAAPPRAGWTDAGWAAGAAIVMAGIVCSVVLAQGTSVSELIDGILLAPLRHPVAFNLRYLWPPGITLVAAGSLGLAIGAQVTPARYARHRDLAIAAARIAASSALAVNLARYPMVSPDYAAFGWGLPLLWPFLWRLPTESATAVQARNWVGLLLLGQWLHVFPVPGSQIAWGTLLAVPLAAIGSWEAGRYLATGTPQIRSPLRLRGLHGAIAVILVLFAGTLAAKFVRVADRYRGDLDLALPGAEAVRVPLGFSSALRLLAVNAHAHADVLFSFPGMFSFNLWSGVPTPTFTNVTHWFSLLSPDRQEEIMRALAAQPEAVVIVHREHIRFLETRSLGPRGVLRDYVEAHFTPAFVVEDYEFRVRQGRTIVPFNLGEIFARSSSAVGAPNSMLRLPVWLPPGSVVSAIDWVHGDSADALLQRLDRSNSQVEVAALATSGEPAGPAAVHPWPLRLEAPAQLSVYFNRAAPAPRKEDVLLLRDPAGHVIATARLRI